LSIILEGSLLNRVEGEEKRRFPGDIFFTPPALPHDHEVLEYPVHYMAIFFRPSLLIEMAPERDGQILLHRFLARQSLDRRVVSVPKKLWPSVKSTFLEMAREAEANVFGCEIRLRTLLLNLLVELRRWEISSGQNPPEITARANWPRVCRALNYLREHSTESIYAKDLAQTIGTSQSRLRALFHDHLGTTWGHCLEVLRLEQAAALLCDPVQTISEIALSCGFQSLSHFNTRFQRLMGSTPTAYRAGYRTTRAIAD
jgi:AraC-like DNA-binding protein